MSAHDAAGPAGSAEASFGIGGPVAGAGGAPPLGNRPNEPMPGKQSLADPQGKAAAAATEAKTPPQPSPQPPRTQDDGDKGGGKGGQDGGVCPDCGLPYSEHPDYAAGGHRPAHAGPPESQGSDSHAAARGHGEHLPGEEIDSRGLGGDPAGA